MSRWNRLMKDLKKLTKEELNELLSTNRNRADRRQNGMTCATMDRVIRRLNQLESGE